MKSAENASLLDGTQISLNGKYQKPDGILECIIRNCGYEGRRRVSKKNPPTFRETSLFAPVTAEESVVMLGVPAIE